MDLNWMTMKMMSLLTSSNNLDWFETEVKGRQVYILSFDIDHDLYLIKFYIF